MKFKSERGLQGTESGSSSPAGSRSQFRGRRSGNSSATTYGKGFYIDYSRNHNPSKRGRFRGIWDAQGNYADLD